MTSETVVPATDEVADKYIDTFIEDVQDNKEFVRAVLKNQLRNQEQQENLGSTENKMLPRVLQTAKEATQELKAVTQLISLVPMSGPIGVAFLLRYSNSNSEGRRQMDVKSYGLEARSRKMKCILPILPSADLADESAKKIGREIATEYTREIVGQLQNLASEHEVTINVEDDDMLLSNIRESCNQIATDTQRGRGNWIITDSDTLKNKIEHLNEYVPATSVTESAINEVGTLRVPNPVGSDITIKVFVTDSLSNEIIVGYKGVSDTDTGISYHPYILILAFGDVLDTASGELVTLLGTRYAIAKDELSSKYYRKIILK